MIKETETIKAKNIDEAKGKFSEKANKTFGGIQPVEIIEALNIVRLKFKIQLLLIYLRNQRVRHLNHQHYF